MADGLELVSRLIAQYAKVEELYLHGGSAQWEQLEECITELYVAILVYLSKAGEYYDRGTAGDSRAFIPHWTIADMRIQGVSPEALCKARRVWRNILRPYQKEREKLMKWRVSSTWIVCLSSPYHSKADSQNSCA